MPSGPPKASLQEVRGIKGHYVAFGGVFSSYYKAVKVNNSTDEQIMDLAFFIAML